MSLFRELAELAEKLAGEPGRLRKRGAIAEAIRRVHEAAPEREDAGLFALYLAGTPFAEADPRKLNAGGALLSRALLEVSGATQVELTAAYKRHGDLGAAGFDLLQARHSAGSGLTLAEVADTFAAMAVARTTAVRARLVEELLRRAAPLEAKYLLKLMLGDMRIGVKQSLVEEAIAAASSSSAAEVRHAVMLEADLSLAVERAFAGTLKEARMRLFHPLGFMLASPVDSPEEAVERFAEASIGEGRIRGRKADPSTALRSIRDDGSGEQEEPPHIAAFLEDKYDGMRAQVHCGDPSHPGRVAIYSRNKEDVTESYPDLEEAFAKVTKADVGPLIFDGEILGWDLKESRALPFAVLGQRIGRKRVSNAWREQVPVIFMAFDLIYAEDELLLGLPLRERRNRLEAVVEKLVQVAVSPLTIDERRKAPQGLIFEEPEGERVERLMLAPSRTVESAEDIDRAYADARARANEGVMLKAADSMYQPGRRGLAWLKLKRELATLDVVVTGAEFGHGKRAGILSDYTFAVRGPNDAKDGELLNVGKAYSGLTDAEIAEMSAWMMEHTLEDHGFFRTVEPLRVLEVAFNNVMRSDRHASGFALRFPRIVRIRDDKPVDEIDTLERVEEVYQSQVDKPVEPKSEV
ncbi:ATP-dependent DNA ligase [Edaphobacter sp. 12200R-103]|uniref:ATP-dependent DNA ligase n=1 Tax=Edaphobacter sp. 12200R-103 TaxID=2703788 RepID=UPI00138B23CA|nr:ATP-dependent DNA ligase [Edaphobacter sp. 12200R-103]QHS52505.1 ATP-dependent DNA ligase [Edaphobacter sp. 12200R-103]